MKDRKQESFDLLLKQHLLRNQLSGKSAQDCPDENTLAAYLEGLLSQELRSDFERHASLCSRCQKELALALKTAAAARKELGSALKTSKSSWWSGFFAFPWVHNLALKPALAIFVVALVSGYIGYEIVQQREVAKEPAEALQAELPKTTLEKDEADSQFGSEPKLDRPVGENAPSSSDTRALSLRAVSKASPREEEGQAPVPQSPAFRDATKVGNEPDALESGHDPVSTTAPVKEDKERRGNREDMFAASNDTAEQKAGVADDLERSSTAGKAPAAPTPPSRQVQTKSQVVSPATSREEENVGAGRTAVGVVSLAKKKAGERSNETSADKDPRQEETSDSKADSNVQALEAQTSRVIEVGGKLFELRNNVWTDTSIDGSEGEPVRVRKTSSQYSALTKSLAAFRDVLTREQDCLIKFKGKVYHVTQK